MDDIGTTGNIQGEDIRKDNNENLANLRKADLITSFVLFTFGLYMLIESLKMPVTELTGSPDKWYTAPGIFPAFIGVILMFESVLLFFYGLKESNGISLEDIKKALLFLKTPVFIRFAIALSLLIIYVFLMLGTVKYEIATFIYLFINMVIFKTEKTSVKKIIKILVICGVASFVIGYGFSHFARIPLP